MLDLSFAIQRFQHNVLAISALVAEVDTTQARWKPAPQEWSILEVIHHLYDEEREDFRLRLDLILHHPDVPWPPIDPEGWVTARRSSDRAVVRSRAAAAA